MQIELDASEAPLQVAAKPKEMLSWGKLPDGRLAFRINFSSLSMMQQCWRKVEYSLVRGLRSNLESPATLFGTAIHKALEVYYSGERTDRKLPPRYKDTMDMIGCGQWEADWSEHLVLRAARAFVEKASPLSALPDDNKHSVVTGVWLLRHYFERYLDDEYSIVRDATGPMTERSVQLRIFEDQALVIDLFGTIDFIMRSEVTGLILPGDHKTTSSLYDFYDSVAPNHQYTAYLMMTREVLGYETDSFLVNAIQKKSVPKTARGSGPDFARQVTTRSEDDFTELRDAIMLNVMTFAANMQAKTWPQTAPGPCGSYGGCQFREVCAAPKSLREGIITNRYKDVTSGKAQ